MLVAKRFLATLVGVLGISLLAIVVLWGLTILEKSRAEAFLRGFTKLVVDKSPYAEAQSLAHEYGGEPWFVDKEDMRCNFQKCELRFVFENKPLSSFRLVRYVALVGTVSVKNGIVVGRSISYSRDSKDYYQFVYQVMESSTQVEHDVSSHQETSGLSRLKVDSMGVPSSVWVKLDNSSTSDKRSRAYALNLSCMSKLVDCNSPSSMFPPG